VVSFPVYPWRHLIAVLVLLAFVFAGIEQTLAHTHDGCVLETHCIACLLELETPAVVAVIFSAPPVVPLDERVASAPVVTHEQSEPKHALSRGPPAIPTTLS
jgi:hypothetical protein